MFVLRRNREWESFILSWCVLQPNYLSTSVFSVSSLCRDSATNIVWIPTFSCGRVTYCTKCQILNISVTDVQFSFDNGSKQWGMGHCFYNLTHSSSPLSPTSHTPIRNECTRAGVIVIYMPLPMPCARSLVKYSILHIPLPWWNRGSVILKGPITSNSFMYFHAVLGFF